jgi:hypothetical protein
MDILLLARLRPRRAPRTAWPPASASAGRSSLLAALPLILLLPTLLLLAGCTAHPGGDELAFLRGGQLWTIDRDGTQLVQVGGGNVVGFAWSPDHHQLVFRYGNQAMAPPDNASAPDAPSFLGVVGVDGGAVVTISPSVASLAHSDAWWDPDGNRLLYREGLPSTPGQEPTLPFYVLSQADQPAGLARRVVVGAAGIPAMAPDGSQVALVDADGNVRLGLPGKLGKVIAQEALLSLPESQRPARLLWRPGRQTLLYATADESGGAQLVIADLAGHGHVVGGAPALLDYAFSPDGAVLLVQTPTTLAVWRVDGPAGQTPLFSWPESDSMALAWWSPDSHYVLVRDHGGLWLADVRARSARQLLASAPTTPASPNPPSWHPLAGSPWSADGQTIAFTDPGTGSWLGRPLPTLRGGRGGLYVVGVAGHPSEPRLIDTGSDQWPSWSYLDPSASFLVAS